MVIVILTLKLLPHGEQGNNVGRTQLRIHGQDGTKQLTGQTELLWGKPSVAGAAF